MCSRRGESNISPIQKDRHRYRSRLAILGSAQLCTAFAGIYGFCTWQITPSAAARLPDSAFELSSDFVNTACDPFYYCHSRRSQPALRLLRPGLHVVRTLSAASPGVCLSSMQCHCQYQTLNNCDNLMRLVDEHEPLLVAASPPNKLHLRSSLLFLPSSARARQNTILSDVFQFSTAVKDCDAYTAISVLLLPPAE